MKYAKDDVYEGWVPPVTAHDKDCECGVCNDERTSAMRAGRNALFASERKVLEAAAQWADITTCLDFIAGQTRSRALFDAVREWLALRDGGGK